MDIKGGLLVDMVRVPVRMVGKFFGARTGLVAIGLIGG
mgnify:CR=1 FL=1